MFKKKNKNVQEVMKTLNKITNYSGDGQNISKQIY